MEKAIDELKKLGERHVTTEKIKNLVNQVQIDEEHYSSNNDEEIRNKSIEMLEQLTYAFLQPTAGGILN